MDLAAQFGFNQTPMNLNVASSRKHFCPVNFCKKLSNFLWKIKKFNFKCMLKYLMITSENLFFLYYLESVFLESVCLESYVGLHFFGQVYS